MKALPKFIAMGGNWNFSTNIAKYNSLNQELSVNPFGLALMEKELKHGSIKCKIKFIKKEENVSARIILGYDSKTKEYYSIGIGGYGYAYVIDIYREGIGWKGLQLAGKEQDIIENKDYEIFISIFGQKLVFKINNVRIFDFQLPGPLKGDQLGLFTWGKCVIDFSEIQIESKNPKIFVVMQFSEPYDSLYQKVIKPVCEKNNFEVIRIDEVYKPGIILKDIITEIVESEIIIADITPANANVFYELGYAHALNKITILMARRGRELPFDIHSYRVIFYDDTIKGKSEVERNLELHLKNILK